MDRILEKYKAIATEFQELEQHLQDPLYIQNPQKLRKISQRHAEIGETASIAQRGLKLESQLQENKKLKEETDDEEMRIFIEEEIENLEAQAAEYKKEFKKLSENTDPNDKRNVILEIRAGTGGEEAALFASDLFRMYSKYAESQGWILEIMHSNYTGNGGFKEVIARIQGKNAYGKLKNENGVHRVQRIPSTESSGRIHTSAASVVMLPEVDDIPDIQIQDNDIKIDVYRATGPGGQSVNTTDSAVRITHIQTGIVVTCQDEKSQHKNKARALSVLKSKLYSMEQDKLTAQKDAKRKEAIQTGDRSAKIKTYNFPQNRITDHRIKVTWHNLSEALDGRIDEILIETSLKLANENDT